MKNYERKTIAEVVRDDFRTADVFRKYDIDFCCGGKISLDKICLKKNISLAQLQSDLEKLNDTDEVAVDFKNWAVEELINHIVKNHHGYVNESIETISQYARKVAQVHGHHRPEVIEIYSLFLELATELKSHMTKEEFILFPYINELASAEREFQPKPASNFSNILMPIGAMEAEHESAGAILEKIATLSDSFTPPDEACNTYRVLYSKLMEFRDDLHVHIHLENNILFPKAAQMEAKFQNNMVL